MIILTSIDFTNWFLSEIIVFVKSQLATIVEYINSTLILLTAYSDSLKNMNDSLVVVLLNFIFYYLEGMGTGGAIASLPTYMIYQ